MSDYLRSAHRLAAPTEAAPTSYRAISLRDLAYLVALSEELNFHRAAERCCATQSTLSLQVLKIERYLKVNIFDRDRRHVAVTPIGADLIEHARRARRSCLASNLRGRYRGPQSPISKNRGDLARARPFRLPRRATSR